MKKHEADCPYLYGHNCSCLTTPKDPQAELRRAVAKKLKFWRKKELSDLYYPLDEIMELFQAHQLELLSELLGELNDNPLANTVDKNSNAWLVRDVVSVIAKYREGL